MDDIIERIYRTRSVVGRSGKVHALDSEVDRDEGRLLFEVIRDDPTVVKTLEVGCAYGLSSLHICAALLGRAGASHIIIDPHQTTQWDGAGIRNLEEAGVRFFRLVEAKSEFALPQLLLEQGEGSLDFVFIDGWHTFDHALLDGFYATRLLRTGGYLAVDDVSFPSVRRTVCYFSNYPCYQLFRALTGTPSWKRHLVQRVLSAFPGRRRARLWFGGLYRRVFKDTSLVVLQKVSEDHRNWDWHDDAF